MVDNTVKTVVVSNNGLSKVYKVSTVLFSKLYNFRIGLTFSSTLLELDIPETTLKITGASTVTGTPLCKAVKEAMYKRIYYKQNKSKGFQRKLRIYGNCITNEVVVIDTIVAL